MRKLLLLTFILLTYSGYAQNKLYKHNSVLITTTRMTYPGGIIPFVIDTTGKPNYTDFSSIENWSLHGGYTSLTVIQLKDAIDSLVKAKTFAGCTDAEKDVASEWFVVDKADRDTRHNAAQQEKNAEELSRDLLPKAPEGEIIKYRDAIKNESASNIVITIANLEKWITIEWLDIQRKSATDDQTGIDQGTDILLDSANGNILYNSTTGVATLKAGKVYVLWGTFAVFSIDASETVAITWVKASDNSRLYEGHETRLRPQSSSSDGNNQPITKLTYKPTVDTDVKLHCIQYTGTPDTITMYWDRSFATINEIR